MEPTKRKALEAAGYAVYDDAADWLQLTDEERKLVELRVAAARAVRLRREEARLTQGQLAEKLGTSQPGVARIETGGRGVSLDILIRALFAVGGTVADLAAPATPSPAGRAAATSTRKGRPVPKKAGR